MQALCHLPEPLWLALVAALGLCIGSFLNVVIYRLPKIAKRQWLQECQDYLTQQGGTYQSPNDELPKHYSIAWPGSACHHCHQPLRWWHNIPLLSYLVLRGRCAYCHASISLRYPLVELMTAAASVYLALQHGCSLELVAWLAFCYLLIALIWIDFDHKLLLDNLTYPLLWLGLLFSLYRNDLSPESAILGAALGYLSLWSVFWLFKLLTGKEGFGYGDFKLLAALGAWLGPSQLPMIIILAAVVGAVIGLALIASKRLPADRAIPFGPYLGLGGWLAMCYGEAWLSAYLRWTGLA